MKVFKIKNIKLSKLSNGLNIKLNIKNYYYLDPNINEKGEVCLSILRQNSIDAFGWLPTRTISDIIFGINSLFYVSYFCLVFVFMFDLKLKYIPLYGYLISLLY